MKTRGSYYFLAFLSFIVAIGVACMGTTTTPTEAPAPTQPPAPTAVVPAATDAGTTTGTGSTALVTFTDQNKYYANDVGTPWTGKDSGKYALAVLNQLYSKTGKEGDIRVTEEKQQQDGSDRRTWVSKAGCYSGISFFEIRNQTTFLMFTVNYGNDYKDQYLDTLNNVIA